MHAIIDGEGRHTVVEGGCTYEEKIAISAGVCLILVIAIGFLLPSKKETVPDETINYITMFFEAKAEGFNILDESGQDITEAFYQNNQAAYLKEDFKQITESLLKNNATIASPITPSPKIQEANSSTKNQSFIVNRFFNYYRAWPNASSSGDEIMIDTLSCALMGSFT